MSTPLENLRALVRLETDFGPPCTRGSFTVTPVSRSITIGRTGRGWARDAGGEGGATYAWAWPSAVLVEEGGQTSKIPIMNVTRWAQLATVLVASLVLYEMWTRSKRERSDDE